MNFEEIGIGRLQFEFGKLRMFGSFASQTSASFDVQIGCSRLGWIDVHFPCEGHIKARVKGALPADYLAPNKIQELLHRVFVELKIALEETYVAEFFTVTNQIQIQQPTNREGYSDRI